MWPISCTVLQATFHCSKSSRVSGTAVAWQQELLIKVPRNVIRLAAQPTIVRRRQATVEYRRGEAFPATDASVCNLDSCSQDTSSFVVWVWSWSWRPQSSKGLHAQGAWCWKRGIQPMDDCLAGDIKAIHAHHTADHAVDLLYSTLMQRDRMGRVVHSNLRV